MVSLLPSPAAHSPFMLPDAALLFIEVTASRKEHAPSTATTSLYVFTLIVAALPRCNGTRIADPRSMTTRLRNSVTILGDPMCAQKRKSVFMELSSPRAEGARIARKTKNGVRFTFLAIWCAVGGPVGCPRITGYWLRPWHGNRRDRRRAVVASRHEK